MASVFIFAIACKGEPRSGVIVTTTMLEETAGVLLRDLGEQVDIVSIVPPGACPGHFDLSPRSLPAIKNAAVVLLHDYQKALGERIREVGGGSSALVIVPTPGSLLAPVNYVTFIDCLAEALTREFPAAASSILEASKARAGVVEALGGRLLDEAKVLEGRRVIASALQTEFCRWLGLEVVGQLERPEDMAPRELASLLSLAPEVVVANLQEGVGAAEALAERLACPVVVLSNFPGAPDFGQDYEALLKTNVRRLVESLDPDASTMTLDEETLAKP